MVPDMILLGSSMQHMLKHINIRVVLNGGMPYDFGKDDEMKVIACIHIKIGVLHNVDGLNICWGVQG